MNLTYEQFAQIDLDDPFSGSLKDDYREFGDWFGRKASEHAYVSRAENKTIEPKSGS